MDFARFKKCYDRLCEHRAINPAEPRRVKQCQAWYREFRTVTDEVITEAFRHCNLTYDYLPTPAQLSSAISDIRRRKIRHDNPTSREVEPPTPEQAAHARTAMKVTMYAIKHRMARDEVAAAFEAITRLGPDKPAGAYFGVASDEDDGGGEDDGPGGGVGGGDHPGERSSSSEGERTDSAHSCNPH